jgi:hypothetical protein
MVAQYQWRTGFFRLELTGAGRYALAKGAAAK